MPKAATGKRKPSHASSQLELPLDATADLLPLRESMVRSTASFSPAPTEPTEYSPLDERFAKLLTRLDGTGNETFSLAARAVSAAREAGEPCLPLARLGAPEKIREELLRSSVVGRPGEWQPLILDEAGRLYLQRYWAYEQRLAAAIAERVARPMLPLNEAVVERELPRWIDAEAADQRRAVEIALRSHFTVITGGPGTGKTRTVAVIIAILRALAADAGGPAPRLALAAPTGKAAMRLQESIRDVWARIDPAAQIDAAEAVTLHRLLGLQGDSPKPRVNAQHPLTAEVVIVDEASMIDLAMMAKLFAAVPPEARLILLGDRDQLPPVETGHVLGDICAVAAPALAERIVALRRKYRFQAGSGIQELSEAVQAGDVERVLQIATGGARADLHARDLPPSEKLRETLTHTVQEGFGQLLESLADPIAALKVLGDFRILCALREGPYGVENLNRLVEASLAETGLLKPGPRHYAGRLIMILRNDYQLRLFNGDVGVILPDPEMPGELRAFFRAEDGALRKLSPARLPEHETAWAMTVHKSQGSEFGRVLLVLPERESPVVTRELIYTAITRARARVELWYRPETLQSAVARRTEKASGLADAITARL